MQIPIAFTSNGSILIRDQLATRSDQTENPSIYTFVYTCGVFINGPYPSGTNTNLYLNIADWIQTNDWQHIYIHKRVGLFFFSIHGFKKLDLARRLISSIFFSRYRLYFSIVNSCHFFLKESFKSTCKKEKIYIDNIR